MAKKLVAKIKKVLRKVVTPVEHAFGEGFVCKACNVTGLNPITKEVCSVCNGTPEK